MKLDWKQIWNKSISDKQLFPTKLLEKNTMSISCPTRFSDIGAFAISVTPTFNENSLDLEILMFNDNVSLEDLDVSHKNSQDFNTLSNDLVKWELSNRILDRFEISSDGFKSDEEAKQALIDYLNNKATESGRMFDDTLDVLNDQMSITKKESYTRILKSIKENRRFILNNVKSILKNNYKWCTSKNESMDDSVTSFYDNNHNLAAVVSLVDNYLVIDLAKDIIAKVSLMQSDEEIEDEIISDIDNAQAILADREIEQLKDAVNQNIDLRSDKSDTYKVSKDSSAVINDDNEFVTEMCKRVAKLESLYIRRYIRNRH